MNTADFCEDDLPLVTADLPGTGGSRVDAEDFVVEEIPAYLPEGSGDHTFALIEKRELTTAAAVSQICRTLGLNVHAAGYAGLKDKHAVTRQWISFERADPQQLIELELPQLRVLEARRHHNKLRTGHLRGNRFTITLHGVEPEAEQRARAVFERLEAGGLPNYYGAQRFGRAGDNAQVAARALRGESAWPRDKRQRRLLASALQSQLFNAVLARRVAERNYATVLDGEVLQRAGTSATFISDDPSIDQVRVDAGEVAVTGPICGPRMPRPRSGSVARMVEDKVLDAMGADPESFGTLGRIARGGRRALAARLSEITLSETSSGTLRVGFVLPAGSYATVLLRELTKLSS